MKKMNSATWMMSGQDYLENGEVVVTYTKHNLKELQVPREEERGGEGRGGEGRGGVKQ